ncbi:cellulose binding domain-containing protein [Micromonospora sp. WMMC241]|uniref:cellulose binding domain-containing protein n=1 Tax=Micromonospora sp. WMMC241 TaxID=3015159 RepID=UPI0022B71A25|nr:cellulose binding domain-containing protein [Micromonospora sp. WMMC241]MCZ7439289.1 cellulose binding domain-containing protein [Micromonospora sp. WMMC241]
MSRNRLRAALTAVTALLFLLALGPALVSTAPPAVAAAAPVRVMPLGDSITGSPGCWRAVLWNRLQSTGYTDVDFVGTLGPQGCGVTYDGDNEGHGGYLATNIANQNLLPGWLAATHPDVVLMHLGTNDVWSNIAPATILAAYSKLVDQMRAANPATTVLVAKIIPMNPSSCPECGQRTIALNAAVDGWAAGKTTAASPVVVVDQWTGFNTATDTYDGVHPNAAGDQKMSDRWYPALTAALHRTTPTPTTSPSPTPTSTPTSTPSPSPTWTPTGPPHPTDSPSPTPTVGGCAATWRTAGQWPGGFQAEITVRNNGAVPIHFWVVRFALSGGQRITQAWSAQVAQGGTAVTARSATWNGALAPGAEATFGFLADGAVPNPVPLPACALG